MTRRHWILAGAVAAVAALVLAALVLRPFLDPSSPGGPAAAPSPTMEPWESTDLPGYDPDPGAFTLDAPDSVDDPITASLASSPDAADTSGAVGLSFDATELANPMWGSDESNLQLTLAELDRPALRFGGNGVDRRMWWTSSDEPAPDWAEATVTPEDLERVAGVAESVDAEVTLVLDLGHDDPERAADMAAHAQDILGDRLLAVTVGNEPNGFQHPNQPQLAVRGDGWDPEQYQTELVEYADAIDDAAPGLPIAGPGAYDAPWWRAFAEADLPQAEALSMHWYPLWDCEGPDSSIANPTVEDLTSPAIRERAGEIIGMGRDVADEHGLPLWMEETGPTSCPGTNETSRTHAQALWTSDFVLTSLDAGVERMAFHSTLDACRGGAPMSPVCATGELEDPGLVVGGRTSFLSLIQLGQMPDGRVLEPTVSGDGTVMVHGVMSDDGQLALLVVDLRDPDGGADDAAVEVSAPTGLDDDGPTHWTLSEGSRLAGDALDAQESRLGALASVDGDLAGATLDADTPLAVPSAPGSVTLLTLDPDEGGEETGESDGGGEG